jgi:HD superfamily phosphohydrolase
LIKPYQNTTFTIQGTQKILEIQKQERREREQEKEEMAQAVRDAVHGWIRYSMAEKKLIDTPLFQRLRYVSQLTAVTLVYPGGHGSRLEHSLGAMHVAGMYATALSETLQSDESDEFMKLARIAALLHDIGHGPYSHAFDRAVYSKIYTAETMMQLLPAATVERLVKTDGHDCHRHYIVHNDAAIQLALAELAITPESIESVWLGKAVPNASLVATKYCKVLSAIVQGPLGADRIDFMMRDSYYTGMEHLGTIAHTRIIDHAMIIDGSLAYSDKVIDDITHALGGRQHLYSNLYMHKTVTAGSILIEHIMQNLPGLAERTTDLDKFALLNDMIIQEALSIPALCQIAERFLKRQLPKLLEETTVYGDEPQQQNQQNIVTTRVISGIDPEMFEKYDVCFYNNKHPTSLISCKKILESRHYQPPVPFKVTRVYNLNIYAKSD